MGKRETDRRRESLIPVSRFPFPERREARLSTLIQDLRFALRALRKHPGFTATAVVTLALGIGANSAIFSVVHHVLLEPLPYAEPHGLYTVFEQTRSGRRLASYPAFADWRRHTTTLDLAYVRGRSAVLRGAEGAELVLVAYASERFFEILGTTPLLGRAFLRDEEQIGAAPVAVISHDFWQRRFGGDPAAVGQTIHLDETVAELVGVLPPRAGHPEWADLWVPLGVIATTDPALEQHVRADSRVIGRLAAAVSLGEGQAEMNAIAHRVATDYEGAETEVAGVALVPLTEQLVGEVRLRLLFLLAAVGLVLLIACVNVASLTLARASARHREIAVRVALGAGRRRIARLVLAESVVLAALGGITGLLLAVWTIGLLRPTSLGTFPQLGEVALDATVLGYTASISLLAAVLVGLIPAWTATPDVADALRGGSGTPADRRTHRLRGVLVAIQVAVALVLLAGAGLLVKSLWRLGRVELGLNPERVVTFPVNPPSPRYDDAERALDLYRRLAEAAAGVRGVEAAALTNHLPLTGASLATRVIPEGGVDLSEGERLALFRTISPHYFRVLDIAVIQGRSFTESDVRGSQPVFIVNETAARQYWPSGDPVGKRLTVLKAAQLRTDFGEPMAGDVVGVTADVRHFGPESPPQPEVYVPYTHNAWSWISLVVRANTAPARIVPQLRKAILDIDPDIPVASSSGSVAFRTMDELLGRRLAPRRLNLGLLGSFALCALALVTVGIYGLMAYFVARRTREIGIRVALGARPPQVVGLIVRHALRPVFLGTLVGTLAAGAGAPAMQGLVYDVTPIDPGTFAATAALVLATALLAAYIPARRAARRDPMEVLRDE